MTLWKRERERVIESRKKEGKRKYNCLINFNKSSSEKAKHLRYVLLTVNILWSSRS